jgi:hypothetical protein
LNNEHCFKDDPELGKMLKQMWADDLSKKSRKIINTREIGYNGLELPKKVGIDACYACPTNAERNSIWADNFRQHILDTHPPVESDQEPPQNTIVIEADIQSSSSKKRKWNVDNVLRHRILTTCGDADVKSGTKCIDPALCLYIGAFLICIIKNDFLKEKVPRGNGTLCRLVGMKLKNDGSKPIWRNYHGRKVWTVCAKDCEWIECEHVVKTSAIIELEKNIEFLKDRMKSLRGQEKRKVRKELKKMQKALIEQCKTQRFRLEPQKFTTTVSVKPHHLASTRVEFTFQMTQFPVNISEATTGHKLQGMSKDVVIITSWPKGGWFKNWEYTVLSRVRTLKGLYLFEAIDMDKSFKPSDELKAYLKRAKNKEKQTLLKQKCCMAELARKRKQAKSSW